MLGLRLISMWLTRLYYVHDTLYDICGQDDAFRSICLLCVVPPVKQAFRFWSAPAARHTHEHGNTATR